MARDGEFCPKRLAGYMPGFELYLQFDSLREKSASWICERGGFARRCGGGQLERLNEVEHFDDAGGDVEEGG